MMTWLFWMKWTVSGKRASAAAAAIAEAITMVEPEVYLEKMSGFSRMLRLEGFSVGPQETADACRILVTLGFEDGFALDLPADWLHYPLTQEMADMGVIYCLSNASGECWMYIQSWKTDCADMDELLNVISAASDPGNSGIREFNGNEFIIYNIAAENVSCCAAMVGDRVLNFVFTPQNDMDFMAKAVQIIGTFREV